MCPTSVRLLLVMRLESSVRLYGSVHVYDDITLVILMAYLSPKFLLRSWSFMCGCFLLRCFQGSECVFVLRRCTN